jgi:XTP/dITP diphosphohydrolase
MKIVFATNNSNKLKEVRALLPTIEILSLKDIKCFDDIEETEVTLEGNAKLKADYITEKFGLDCFADDTGLELEALDNAPGVYSARYAGEPSDSEKNIEKVLSEMKDKENRIAQFRTVVALNLKNDQFLFEGICKGEISKTKNGNKGFGYDPIFIPKGYKKSFAEMSMDEKGEISHRGKAIQELITFLNSI